MPSQTLPARDAARAVLVALIWGVNFIAIDRGLQSMPPLLFVALRFLLVCFPAVLFVPRPQAPWRLVLAVGTFMSLGQFSLVYLAMHLGMPAGLTPLVLQTQVLLTVLFSSLALREHPTRGQLAGVVVGAAGLAVVAAGRSAQAPLLPLLLVVLAAASWAVGNVLARRARPTSGLSMVVWSGLVVPGPMVALSLLVEGPAALTRTVTHPDTGALLSAVFTAYLASLLGYGLWNSLLARHPVSAVVPYTMLVPVAGITAAWLALGEVPTALEVLGGVLLLAGVAAAALLARRSRVATPTTTAGPEPAPSLR